MPNIPKKSNRVGFQTGGTAEVVRPTELVGPEIISDSFAEQLGGMIIERAENQQKQINDNSVNSGNIGYQERLISIMEDERTRQGKDTEGNQARYEQQSKLIRDEILKEANPVVKARLQEKFTAIDLKNVSELSKIRSQGLSDEREANHLNAQEVAKKDVLNNPLTALFQIASRTEMYDQEAENGTMDRATADENIRIMADDLASAALVSMGEKFGPEAQLQAIDSGMFDKVISADKLEEMRKQAVTLEKAIEDQKKLDEKNARIEADRKAKEAANAAYKDFAIRYDDEENPYTIPELEKSAMSGKDIKTLKEFLKKPKTNTTDIAFYNLQLDLIRDGKVEPGDVRPIPGKLSIADADKLNNKAETIIKEDEKPYNEKLKTATQDARTRILKGSILRGYDALSVKRANLFQNHLEIELEDKGLEQRLKMITPGSAEYIIDDLVETYKPSEQEKIQDRRKALIERQEDETIEQFLKRKQKKFVRLDDPNRIKAVDELKKRKIKVTPERIKLTIEFFKRRGEKK
jgi:hypothetical protein